jgi:hypothetical protein
MDVPLTLFEQHADDAAVRRIDFDDAVSEHVADDQVAVARARSVPFDCIPLASTRYLPSGSMATRRLRAGLPV